MIEKESPGKYWICEECATDKGGKCTKIGNTYIYGTCSWCGGRNQLDRTLTPVLDFKWSRGMPDPNAAQLCKKATKSDTNSAKSDKILPRMSRKKQKHAKKMAKSR